MPPRVMIASANPLFREALQSLLVSQFQPAPLEFKIASTTTEAIQLLESWQPTLIILDYDDSQINPQKFLNQFVQGISPGQLMLVSLHSSGAITVYERRSLPPDEVSTWLDISLNS